MLPIPLAFVCVGFYIILSVLQIFVLSKKPMIQRLIYCLATLNCLLHGYLLYRCIDLPSGQNLTVTTMASFSVWLLCVTLCIMGLKTYRHLLLLLWPFSALTIVTLYYFPYTHLVSAGQSKAIFLHIALSFVTLAFILMAALQALLLWIQEWALRRRGELAILRYLPPLELSEQQLFFWLRCGFVLLTFLLALGFYTFSPLPHYLISKVLIALLAWSVFAGLLSGRYLWGWRGLQVVRWTLSGLCLIVLATLFLSWIA